MSRATSLYPAPASAYLGWVAAGQDMSGATSAHPALAAPYLGWVATGQDISGATSAHPAPTAAYLGWVADGQDMPGATGLYPAPAPVQWPVTSCPPHLSGRVSLRLAPKIRNEMSVICEGQTSNVSPVSLLTNLYNF